MDGTGSCQQCWTVRLCCQRVNYDQVNTWFLRLCLRGLPTMRRILVPAHRHCLAHWWCWRLPVSTTPATSTASSHHSWGCCRGWHVNTSHPHHLMKPVQVNALHFVKENGNIECILCGWQPQECPQMFLLQWVLISKYTFCHLVWNTHSHLSVLGLLSC